MSAVTQGSRPSRIAKVMLAIARATNPTSRQLAGRRFFPLWAVLRHRGRRSGRAYAIPVAVGVSADAFVIPVPWGDQTQWVRNVLAAGGCTLRWRGEDHDAREPRVIGPEEAAAAFSPALQAILRFVGIARFVRLQRVTSEANASTRGG
jgi:deazaflavin-dependent oxidoreductase (nitroreductase family)